MLEGRRSYVVQSEGGQVVVYEYGVKIVEGGQGTQRCVTTNLFFSSILFFGGISGGVFVSEEKACLCVVMGTWSKSR